MNKFEHELTGRLAAAESQGLRRKIRPISAVHSPRITVNGKELLNFSSNDYLGLANDSLLKSASIKAVEEFGAGSGASRLICGSLAPHLELDEAIAQFKSTESALSYSSGYAAALGAICALVGKQDIVILDKLAHACLVDGARLSGAKIRVFRHNDLNYLEDLLKWASKVASTGQRILIVTESIFSMDGDRAPLREIVRLKDRYGAWLMVDEAHATGLFGPAGQGLVAELNLGGQVEIQMGTLSKALGASGGYICGSQKLIDYLINFSRTFIFSTAPVPASAAAATAAIQFVQSKEGRQRRELVWQRVEQIVGERRCGNSPEAATNPQIRSTIIPIIIGSERQAVASAEALLEAGIFVPAIRYPSVPRSKARLRITVNATHTSVDACKLLDALAGLQISIGRSTS